ncbi:MAG: hypothetical protein QMC89_06565, partial [Candidatus Hodarchaeaceae archaeon]|nr:hypothetical protein [Candidatus Hodarchaeaceae archaeon]
SRVLSFRPQPPRVFMAFWHKRVVVEAGVICKNDMAGAISEIDIKVDSKALLNLSVLTYCLLF